MINRKVKTENTQHYSEKITGALSLKATYKFDKYKYHTCQGGDFKISLFIKKNETPPSGKTLDKKKKGNHITHENKWRL